MTATERQMSARAAAHESWAHTPDRSARTANARAAMLARFEHDVDPDSALLPAERAKRAESARKAYYTRLALKSARARRLAKFHDEMAAEAEAEIASLGGLPA